MARRFDPAPPLLLAALFFLLAALAPAAAKPLRPVASSSFSSPSSSPSSSSFSPSSFSPSSSSPSSSSPSSSASSDSPYYEFIPAFRCTLFSPDHNDSSSTASLPCHWSSRCFESVDMQVLTWTHSAANISITTKRREHVLCDDAYLFATRFSSQWELVRRGRASMELSFHWTSDEERASAMLWGIQVFALKDGAVGSMEDLVKTLLMWLGTPRAQARELQMLQERMDWSVQARNNSDPVPPSLPQSAFRSGDQLAIFKLEANDGLIMLGTGAHTGHHTAMLWIDGALYVVESCESSCVGTEIGIQKTLWEEWWPRALARNFSVAWLPLADEYSEAFNETAAIAWFKSVEGLPYGSHNFFFGWVDTDNLNYPPPLSAEFIIDALPVLDAVAPRLVSEWIGEALNLRLGTNGLGVHELYNESERQGITVQELFNLPEQDTWQYSDGYSMVCNVFWLELLKNAGVFGSFASQFQATEFTPKDAYQMSVFMDAWDKPVQCDGDDLPYCQLFGPYVVDLAGYNSRPLYANMSENCASFPPKYFRSNKC